MHYQLSSKDLTEVLQGGDQELGVVHAEFRCAEAIRYTSLGLGQRSELEIQMWESSACRRCLKPRDSVRPPRE